jgi:acyl-CoA synthetase (AMP-forming)/AMP-acid ligase II
VGTESKPESKSLGVAQLPQRPLLDYLTARGESERPAFTYLDCSSGRRAVPHTLSGRELLARVCAVSARLRSVVASGDRVAVLAEQDLDYVVGFLGALHAGAVAVPLFAPTGGAHRARLIGALNDCDARVWLTSSRLLDKLRGFEAEDDVPRPTEIIVVDSLPAESPVTPVAVTLDEPAYLQYTSGSTRDPLGAVITHGR